MTPQRGPSRLWRRRTRRRARILRSLQAPCDPISTTCPGSRSSPARRTTATTSSMVWSKRAFLRRHSQTTTTVHPPSTSSERTRASRARLRANFASQNSALVLGRDGPQNGQRCQKHPLTKMATLRPGNAMSGLPGALFHWRRYPVRPAARRAARTLSSGVVFLLRLACMTWRVASEDAGGVSGRREATTPGPCRARWAHPRS